MSTPEKIDSENVTSKMSREKLAQRLLQGLNSDWREILRTSVVPLEQKLDDFIMGVEEKANEVLNLSAISDEENEETEEAEKIEEMEEAEKTEEVEKTEVEKTEVEKKSSPDKSSKFLNCGDQLVIRKDAFSHAYEHPANIKKVRIYFSVDKRMQSHDIDVLLGEAGSVIRNIYKQLSE